MTNSSHDQNSRYIDGVIPSARKTRASRREPELNSNEPLIDILSPQPQSKRFYAKTATTRSIKRIYRMRTPAQVLKKGSHTSHI